jgi:GTP-binding protein
MEIRSANFVKGVIGTDDILYDGVPQIAFVGRSNVGKSSVINALVNRTSLVRVGKKPGKTTELNFYAINRDTAEPYRAEYYFVDLPGYGYAKVDPKTKEKIEKLILWYLMYSEVKPYKVAVILDTKVGLTDFDKEMIRVLNEHGHPFMIIANKTDKLNQKDLAKQLETIRQAAGSAEVVPYSAVEKKDTEHLRGILLASSR